MQTAYEQEWAQPPGWPLRPQHIVRDIRQALAPDDLVICDVGAHKLWMARMFPCEVPNTCIISNGFASMGMALPGAVAAKLLFPARRVVAVTGDGGFLMNVQELETAVRLHLPLVVLIWRDNGYGVIRWKQQMKFGRTSGVEFGNPDFVALAQSFGAVGYRVEGPSELGPVLNAALSCGKPAVIDCPVDYSENLRLSEQSQSARNYMRRRNRKSERDDVPFSVASCDSEKILIGFFLATWGNLSIKLCCTSVVTSCLDGNLAAYVPTFVWHLTRKGIERVRRRGCDEYCLTGGIALLAFAGGASVKELNVSQPERDVLSGQSHLFDDLHPLSWGRGEGRWADEVYSSGRRPYLPGGSRKAGCEIV